MAIRTGIVYKLRKSLRERGFAGTVKECLRVAPIFMRMMTPSWRRYRAEQKQFDAERGIFTDALIFLDDLDIPGPNVQFGGAYQATSVGDLEKVLDQMALGEGYTFIDLGCGLGRPLFAAAAYPFERIIGVEFSPDLHQLAAKNVENFRRTTGRDIRIDVLCMDAVDFVFPPEKTVLFLFNPFKRPVLEKVLANLERSLKENPRHVVILYRNPSVRDMFDKAPFLRLVSEKPRWAMYETSIAPKSAQVN